MKKSDNQQRGAKRPFRFYIASLGCPKNTVDSSGMAVLLQRAGYQPTLKAQQADLLIVNTCGFIQSARQESLETLRDLAAHKRAHQRLVAAGCWAQRDPELLLQTIPGLDAVIGTRSWTDIVSLIAQVLHERQPSAFALIEDKLVALPEQAGAPGYVVSGASAFLKIADGCSRQCAFCAIPAIKGPTVSRAMDVVIADALELQDMGMLEVNLIAQDATYYGYDLGMKDGLAQLLERMALEVPNIPWIRILYAYPGYVTPRLMDAVAQIPQVLPYIDIPLQHAHPDVLRRMRRPANVQEVRRTIEQLRQKIPGVALRTTFIVGFPGETDAEFATLLDFVEDVRFDRLGVFTYSHEFGTTASTLKDDVPMDVKEARREELMLLQQSISQKLNQAYVGRDLDVLLEGSGDGITVGRCYRDAPEIDGLVLLEEELPPHRIISVEITQAMPYDLVGKVAQSP